MTTCIAALCGRDDSDPTIVMCADRRIENAVSGAEVGRKLVPFKKGWWTLYSGIGVHASELTWLYHSALRDEKLDEEVSLTLDVLQRATDTYRRNLAEKHCQAMHKMSYADLLESSTKLPKEIFDASMYDIQKIELTFELIIGGFINGLPHLFVVDTNGTVRLGDQWEAIGKGAYCAQAMLYYRKQNDSMALALTLYHVFEAKAFSENAGSVGEETEITIHRNDRIVKLTNEEPYRRLREQFAKFGPQPVIDPEYPVTDSSFFSPLPNVP